MGKLLKYMSFKRAKNMFFLKLARVLPIQGHLRYKLVKLGGVNIEGKCYIYSDVRFDTTAPELITIKKEQPLQEGHPYLPISWTQVKKDVYSDLGKSQ